MKKYFLYAVGETLLIVFGILIALQVNNLNENRIRKNNELTIYETIKDQLENYKIIIEDDIQYNKKYMIQFERANEIIEQNDRTKIDTLGKLVVKLIDHSDFDGRGNIYETLVNSGEIKILTNHRIIDGLRELEERFLHINRIENIHYDAVVTQVIPRLQVNVNLSNGAVLDNNRLYEADFQNLLFLVLRIMYEKEDVYNSTIRDIDNLIILIDDELKDI
ncbi:MAG: DUF6090 family protein [Flavobacteriaceae bacterium]